MFCLRLTDEERVALERLRRRVGGPRALGPWLKWAALRDSARLEAVIPEAPPGAVLPEVKDAWSVPLEQRTILDLCGGTGAWSKPYREAGYPTRIVTLPHDDVRTWKLPPQDGWRAWGVLAAPPCTEFSLAKNGQVRDIRRALEVVGACFRIIHSARPRWWALENPVGLLRHWLGEPRDSWEPCDFGDPWTKRTAVWGNYAIPKRSYVAPLGGGPLCAVCDPGRTRFGPCRKAEHRAITPPGFARAFFEVNP